MRVMPKPGSARSIPSSRPYLPFRNLVLCLDCDMCFDISAAICPACGSDSWVVIGRFLTDALTRRPSAGVERRDPRPGPGPRVVLIVALHQPELYAELKRAFAEEVGVEVVLDRRASDRRAGSNRPTVERRRGDRRTGSSVDDRVRTIGWALVRLGLDKTSGAGPGGARDGRPSVPVAPRRRTAHAGSTSAEGRSDREAGGRPTR
jgi:hypothetical protein